MKNCTTPFLSQKTTKWILSSEKNYNNSVISSETQSTNEEHTQKQLHSGIYPPIYMPANQTQK
jgi:hypothetical protein